MADIVSCASCLKKIDTNECVRIATYSMWHFFCRDCENDGSARAYMREVFKSEKNKSGAAMLEHRHA